MCMLPYIRDNFNDLNTAVNVKLLSISSSYNISNCQMRRSQTIAAIAVKVKTPNSTSLVAVYFAKCNGIFSFAEELSPYLNISLSVIVWQRLSLDKFCDIYL